MRPNRLLVDTGGLFVANPAILNERDGEVAARADLFGQVMSEMGYAGLNVGVHELALGVPELRKFSQKWKIPLLSANLYDQKTGKPAFQRTLVKQVGPLKVGVFGLLSEQPQDLGKYVLDQGLTARDPVAESKAVVAELQAQGCDLIVALTQLRRPEIEKVANQAKGIHVFLGSADMELSMQLSGMGDGYFADAFTKGKYIGEVLVNVRARKDRFYAGNMRASKMAERAEMAQALQGLQAQLESANQPNAPLQLNDETRKVMETQLASTRARLQRLTMELEGVVETPKDASTLDFSMIPLGTEVPDDKAVDARVKKFQVKYPKPAGQH